MASSYKVAVLYLEEYQYLQNLKYNIKKGVYFSFNFGWYSIQLDIVH